MSSIDWFCRTVRFRLHIIHEVEQVQNVLTAAPSIAVLSENWKVSLSHCSCGQHRFDHNPRSGRYLSETNGEGIVLLHGDGADPLRAARNVPCAWHCRHRQGNLPFASGELPLGPTRRPLGNCLELPSCCASVKCRDCFGGHGRGAVSLSKGKLSGSSPEIEINVLGESRPGH